MSIKKRKKERKIRKKLALERDIKERDARKQANKLKAKEEKKSN